MLKGCGETIVAMELLNQVVLIMDNPKIMENPRSSVLVATAGEALIDLIVQPDGKYAPCLGGAVFNLTRALAKQGVGVVYLNPLSRDRFGRKLAAALAADDVQLAQVQAAPESTSLAVVGLDESGHPDYAFYRERVADRAVTAGQLTASCQREASLSIVCTGALALAPDDAVHYLPWLRSQRDAGKVVVVDANLRPSVMPDKEAYRRNVQEAMQIAHVVKVSDEDLDNLAVPGADAMARAQHVLESTGARLVLLTLGAEGACLLTHDGRHWHARETAPVKVVDTVGAGDCFLAGFLAAWLRVQPDTGAADGDQSIAPAARLLGPLKDTAARQLLAHAVASASLCIMRRGCVPPTGDEVTARVMQTPCAFG